MPKWRHQIIQWRDQLGVSDTYLPFTKLGMEIRGMGKLTPRVSAILNMVVAEKVKSSKLRKETKAAVKKTIAKTVVDVSQNPSRKTFTNKDGFMRTMTSSSKLVHLGRGSILLPREMLWLQGHNQNCHMPEHVSMDQIRKLAGEGMALPCLAVCIWSQFLTCGFPSP